LDQSQIVLSTARDQRTFEFSLSPSATLFYETFDFELSFSVTSPRAHIWTPSILWRRASFDLKWFTNQSRTTVDGELAYAVEQAFTPGLAGLVFVVRPRLTLRYIAGGSLLQT
jgi:hypothetical protein